MTIDGKSTTTDYPVALVSGFFRGSQPNWAALMKEAFAIYMSSLDREYYSLDENELLTRKVIDGGHEFHAIYLPSVLIFQVL